jgi:RNA polymerase sigma-70 factor (ECF subfamily)
MTTIDRQALPPDEDGPVVRAVLEGDTEAFRTLVERHRTRVYGLLRRLVGDPDVGEELAQETFVRAYRGLGGFRAEARFGTWLLQIAVHAARDHLRATRRALILPLEELAESDPAALAETHGTFDPLAALEERELAERLEGALTRLPAEYREVFVLKHVEEMPYEEISALTGASVGTLKVRAHRARKLLRDHLAAEEATPRRK